MYRRLSGHTRKSPGGGLILPGVNDTLGPFLEGIVSVNIINIPLSLSTIDA